MKKTLASLMAVLALGVAAGCNDGTDDSEQAQSVATEAVDNAKDTATSAASTAKDAVTSADLPDVDWDKYGQETKNTIDDLAEKGDDDVFRKVAKDLADKGVQVADVDIRRQMSEFLAKAVSDIEGGQS